MVEFEHTAIVLQLEAARASTAHFTPEPFDSAASLRDHRFWSLVLHIFRECVELTQRVRLRFGRSPARTFFDQSSSTRPSLLEGHGLSMTKPTPIIMRANTASFWVRSTSTFSSIFKRDSR